MELTEVAGGRALACFVPNPDMTAVVSMLSDRANPVSLYQAKSRVVVRYDADNLNILSLARFSQRLPQSSLEVLTDSLEMVSIVLEHLSDVSVEQKRRRGRISLCRKDDWTPEMSRAPA